VHPRVRRGTLIRPHTETLIRPHTSDPHDRLVFFFDKPASPAPNGSPELQRLEVGDLFA
jgi:hypothetical protein